MNAFLFISAGVLPFIRNVRGSAVLQAFHRELNSLYFLLGYIDSVNILVLSVRRWEPVQNFFL